MKRLTRILLCIIVALSIVTFAVHATLRKGAFTVTAASKDQLQLQPQQRPVQGEPFALVRNLCRRHVLKTGEIFVAANASAANNTTTVLLLFHGCSHSAHDFCFRDEQCPKCRALPEEVRWVDEGLRRGYAVVAVSSADRHTGCWNTRRKDINQDVTQVTRVLDALGIRPGPSRKLITMGASSGGVFSARFAEAAAEEWGVESVLGAVAQVAAPPAPQRLRTEEGFRFVWSVMARDSSTLKQAERFSKSFKAPDRRCIVTHHALPVAKSYFADRSVDTKAMTLEASHAIVSALEAGHFLDNSTRHLTMDPRHSSWRHVVKPLVAKYHLNDNLRPDLSPIAESLNVAFSQHEFTSENAGAMLDFIANGGRCPGHQ